MPGVQVDAQPLLGDALAGGEDILGHEDRPGVVGDGEQRRFSPYRREISSRPSVGVSGKSVVWQRLVAP